MFGLTPYHQRNGSVDRRAREPFDLESVFEHFFQDTVFPSFYSNSSQMRVDIKETEKEFQLDAELPGAKKEDIHLELHADRLTILVKQDESTNEEKENYIRRERRVSSMQRSFAVENIRQEDVTAKFENGILSIKLPKNEGKAISQRKIDIQ